MRHRHTLLSFAFLLCLGGAALGQTAPTIVFSEFFEKMFIIDPENGSLVPTPISALGVGTIDEIAIESSGMVLGIGFNELIRINPVTGSVQTVAQLESGTFSGLALEADGTVVAVGNSVVNRINPVTGEVVEIADDTFFGPRKVAVAPSGDIYVTEFFEDLIRINPVTLAKNTVTLQSDIGSPNHIDVFPDGDLAILNLGRELYRVDPISGSVDFIGDDYATFIHGIGIDGDGDVLIATSDAVLSVDPDTNFTSIVAFDEPFFSPHDVAFGEVLIPEPAAGLLLASVCLCWVRRRAS